MSELSIESTASARKIEQQVLRKLSETSQVAVAKALNTSESTVSRLKDGQIHVVAQLLAVLGFKLVPKDFQVVNPERAQAMYTLYQAAITQMDNPVELLWEKP